MSTQRRRLSYYRDLPFIAEMRGDPLCADLFPIMCGYHQRSFGWFEDGPRRIADWVLLYALGGEGRLRLKTRDYTLQAGDVALLPGGVAHDYRSAPGATWTYWWVHFGGHSVDLYLQALGWADPMRQPVSHAGIHEHVVELFEEFGGVLTGSRITRHHIHNTLVLRLLLSRLARHIHTGTPEPTPRIDLNALHDLMQSHVNTSLSVPTMARYVSMSEPHFYRRFKEATGATPAHYFLQLKLMRACEHLVETDRTVADIADSLGFSSVYHFSRQFKQHIGMPPSVYRTRRMGSGMR